MGYHRTGKVSSNLDIYVSISKQADPEIVRKTMGYLEAANAYVYSYDNSTRYTTEGLDLCDILLVIPPKASKHPFDHDDDRFVIGKGQFNEIVHFQERANEDNMFLVSDVEGGLHLDEIHGWDDYDPTDWVSGFRVITNAAMINMGNYSQFVLDYAKYAELSELKEPVDNSNPDYGDIPDPDYGNHPEEGILPQVDKNGMPLKVSQEDLPSYPQPVKAHPYDGSKPRVHLAAARRFV